MSNIIKLDLPLRVTPGTPNANGYLYNVESYITAIQRYIGDKDIKRILFIQDSSFYRGGNPDYTNPPCGKMENAVGYITSLNDNHTVSVEICMDLIRNTFAELINDHIANLDIMCRIRGDIDKDKLVNVKRIDLMELSINEKIVKENKDGEIEQVRE